MRLPASLRAWGTADFPAELKRELAGHADELPLQQALSGTSAVADEPVTVVLLDAQADETSIHAKVGIFFAGILVGCSCADDPTPVEPQHEYCELRIEIDRASGHARLSEAM
jgi:hypothetical protein